MKKLLAGLIVALSVVIVSFAIFPSIASAVGGIPLDDCSLVFSKNGADTEILSGKCIPLGNGYYEMSETYEFKLKKTEAETTLQILTESVDFSMPVYQKQLWFASVPDGYAQVLVPTDESSIYQLENKKSALGLLVKTLSGSALTGDYIAFGQ